jgi:hypothetical protein
MPSMALSIRQIHLVLLGEVSGVDLRRTTVAGDRPSIEKVAA